MLYCWKSIVHMTFVQTISLETSRKLSTIFHTSMSIPSNKKEQENRWVLIENIENSIINFEKIALAAINTIGTQYLK